MFHQAEVQDDMSTLVIRAKPKTSILEAVRLLYEHRFNSLPVVGDWGRIVGILTEVDVYLLLLQASDEAVSTPAASPGDPAVARP